MIISHKYKYLFVELPLTASTAVSKELRENYDGESILYKHATYHEFLKIASPEEKKYFVFSGMCNPLDMELHLSGRMGGQLNFVLAATGVSIPGYFPKSLLAIY